MELLLAAIIVLPASGFAALLLGRLPKASAAAGAAGPLAACCLAAAPVFRALSAAPAEFLRIEWSMPFGSATMELDALGAFFLAPVLGLSALSAVYGAGYMNAHGGGRLPGWHWLCFNVLVAAMAAVCLARNALFFLAAWEIMALASFFLVASESGSKEAREASWTYMAAAHAGAAFLIPMFLLLSQGTGSLDFADFSVEPGSATASLCFALALIGFGSKAGIMPLHVWLPEAHPAAPSHVSALMSGVMIKTGIYGLVRVLTMLGPPPTWWGFALIALGAASGVMGVLLALAQHDLKRLLAYHSIENIGIIVMGLGLWILGVSTGHPAMAALGFAGALLHVVNHAVFKGLLFMGAGSVLTGAGTRDVEKLGGLLKRMPATGAAFLVGAAAICGLPPLNGFVSEFLVFLGSLDGAANGGPLPAVLAAAVILSLALIAGLASACFAKAFGIVFLGEPRTPEAAASRESGALMTAPMAILSILCFAIGIGGFAAVQAAEPVVLSVCGPGSGGVIEAASRSLAGAATAFGVLIALAVLLAVLRKVLLFRRESGQAGTWDCGYAAPSAKMQYTASSFAQPLADFFGHFLGQRKHFVPPNGYFPKESSLETETPDRCLDGFYVPAFRAGRAVLSKFLVLQQGRIQIYVLYLVLTLLVLLIWKLGF